MVSSAYNRWEMIGPFPEVAKALILYYYSWNRVKSPLLRASSARIKRLGARGSPCRKPLEEGKSPFTAPLNMTENQHWVNILWMNFNQTSLKPNFLRTANRKGHGFKAIVGLCFFSSSLRTTELWIFDQCLAAAPVLGRCCLWCHGPSQMHPELEISSEEVMYPTCHRKLQQ